MGLGWQHSHELHFFVSLSRVGSEASQPQAHLGQVGLIHGVRNQGGASGLLMGLGSSRGRVLILEGEDVSSGPG